MSDGVGGDAGEGTPFGPGSFEIALLAAGGTITAVDAVLDRRVETRTRWSARRPPRRSRPGPRLLHLRQRRGGDRACARDARRRAGGRRSTGTSPRQRDPEAFYATPASSPSPSTRIAGTRRESGAHRRAGEGPGAGYNINIPLPPGSGHGAYVAAFERVVVPALHAFRPELIVVPSGFDEACTIRSGG